MDLLRDLPKHPKARQINDLLYQQDRHAVESLDRKFRPHFKSFNWKNLAILAALRGKYSTLDLQWVLDTATRKSKSTKGAGGLILAMLRRGQRPDPKASVTQEAEYPAAVEHLRHALAQLHIGEDEKYSDLVDRMVRRWAPVTDHLLRTRYPGASAIDLLDRCLAMGNDYGPVDPDCGKPGVIVSVLRRHMNALADAWDKAVAGGSQAEMPSLIAPGFTEGLASGYGLIWTEVPGLETVLGPREDPWQPGERDRRVEALREEGQAAEQRMIDTGFAEDGTPWAVVRIRRALHDLRTCRPQMVNYYFNHGLRKVVDEVEHEDQKAVAEGLPPVLDTEWKEQVSRKIDEVTTDLVQRGLLRRAEPVPTQSEGGQPVTEEDPMPTAQISAESAPTGTSDADKAAVDAAVASLGDFDENDGEATAVGFCLTEASRTDASPETSPVYQETGQAPE